MGIEVSYSWCIRDLNENLHGSQSWSQNCPLQSNSCRVLPIWPILWACWAFDTETFSMQFAGQPCCVLPHLNLFENSIRPWDRIKLIIYRKVRNDWISCEMDLWKGWASSPALTASGHTTVQRALRVARCCVFLSGGHVNPRRLEDFSEQEVQQQEVLIAPQIASVFFDCLIDCFKIAFGHLKASRYPRVLQTAQITARSAGVHPHLRPCIASVEGSRHVRFV